MTAHGHCRADDYRRKLIGLVGRVASRRYALDPAELGGFCKLQNRDTGRVLWLRVKGRATLRYTEPTNYAVARMLCTPDELRQLRREALTLSHT